MLVYPVFYDACKSDDGLMLLTIKSSKELTEQFILENIGGRHNYKREDFIVQEWELDKCEVID